MPRTQKLGSFGPSVRLGSLFALSLAGCAQPYVSADPRVLSESSIPSSDSLTPGLWASDVTPAAADPSLPGYEGWPLTFAVSIPRGTSLSCEVELTRGASTLATLTGVIEDDNCIALWDGISDGQPARPGPVTVEATLVRGDGVVRASAVLAIEVVRLGIDQIDVDADPGDRAPLLYRRTAGRRGAFHELTAASRPFELGADASESGASALELASGARRATPTPWNDLTSPPLDARSADGVEHDAYNLPMALIAGRTPTLLARLTTAAADGASGDPIDMEVRIVAPSGMSISGQDQVEDGSLITLMPSQSPAPAVGRYDVTYEFSFEARRLGGEYRAIPGSLPITLRYYGLLDTPRFYSNTIPHRTWVDVIDRIAEWVNGTSRDPEAVGARLVEGVYYELGLRYDTARGASFYTSYAGSTSFSGASFEMDAFEERSYGTIVNCSDSASILSTYANMVGLDYRYHILRHRFAGGFDLNYIQAIGIDRFDDTPFDSGRGGFSYHAIVGARDGTTWDATLAVDGDGSPGSTPHTLLLAQGLGAPNYLTALSSEASNIVTTFDDNVRIR